MTWRREHGRLPPGRGPDSPMFVISVAAQLSGLHGADPAQLRPAGARLPRPVGRRRAALLRARHRPAARGAAAVAGGGRQPRGHQADHRAGAARSTSCGPGRGAGSRAEGGPRRRRAGRGDGAPLVPEGPGAGRPPPPRGGLASGTPGVGGSGPAVGRARRVVAVQAPAPWPQTARCRARAPSSRSPRRRWPAGCRIPTRPRFRQGTPNRLSPTMRPVAISSSSRFFGPASTARRSAHRS